MKVVALVLSVVELLSGNLINIALHKPSIQTDEYQYAYGGPASWANDGIADRDYNHKSCSHTNSKVNSWWMVDLLGNYTVVAVNITNRLGFEHRLSKFVVYLSLENPKASSQFPNVTAGAQVCLRRQEMITSDKSEFIPCANPISARYLVVFKPGDEYLTICEIEVLALDSRRISYRMIRDAKISTKPFLSANVSGSGTACMYLCQRAPGGTAIAVQYRRSDKLCECLQPNWFLLSQPAWNYDREWILFFRLI